MVTFLAIVHIFVCIALIGVILLQHRKTGGFSGSFGGAGTQMDASGGSWQRMTGLTKITVAFTAVFMAFSLILVVIS